MRPVGKYRFLLPGEKLANGEYHLVADPANTLVILMELYSYYFWMPVTCGVSVDGGSYVIRKVER